MSGIELALIRLRGICKQIDPGICLLKIDERIAGSIDT